MQILGGIPKFFVEAGFIILICSLLFVGRNDLKTLQSYLPLLAALAFSLQKLLPLIQQIYASFNALRA